MNGDGIAIVGMSGRFPGARDVATFWQNIKNGVESIAHFSDEELEIPAPAFDAGNGSAFVRARGILDDVDRFDAQFFGYLPRDVEMMDPQQRVFLELCWEAIEHAGYDAARYSGAIGVYGGCYLDTYLMWNLSSNPKLLAHLVETMQVGSLQAQLGNDKDYLATRVAFKLGLRGPAMTVQSACSTALVAVATACQSLDAGQCDMALAGAVAIVFPQKKGYFYKEGSIFSPDGHCRTFDERAAGTVFSNGAAVVLLKRVADARADGDTIYAVIRGYALNNNGAAPPSFTAPSTEGQTEVIARAMAMAGVSARTIGYVEAHGTATALGDPVEVAGLTAAYRAHTADSGYCAIGSVKANLGHLDVASGTIGLIKAALSVHDGVLAPSVNFTRPNPRIDFASSPFYVNTELRPWPVAEWPRRAAVTALGIGGTNAHVVLEQAAPPASTGPQRRCSLLVLSARTEAALEAQCHHLAAFLDGAPDVSLDDVAYTLQVGRREFDCRRSVVAAGGGDAAAKLRAVAAPGEMTITGTSRTGTSGPSVVFMFPGQGTQYPGMARDLYEAEPVFRDVIDRCCEALAHDVEHPLDLRPFLLWDAAGSSMDRSRAAAELAQTRLAQPAIFAVEMALARLFESWGVRASAVMGHSVGEFAAACLAGVFDLVDAVRLVATRGRLMQEQPSGTMLAVRAAAATLEPLLPEGVAIAAINAPELTVISGPREEVSRVGTRLAQQGIESSPLVTSHAYHSPMMAPARQRLVDAVAAVARRPADRELVSTAVARTVADAELADPDYWGDQMMRPVRFADSVTVATHIDGRILLEVGPGQTLSTLSRQVLRGRTDRVIVTALGGAQADGSSLESVLEALGRLWGAGVTPDWVSFQTGRRLRVALPTYPFERKRFWIEPTPFESDPRYVAANGGAAAKADPPGSATSGMAHASSRDRPGADQSPGNVPSVQAGAATTHAERVLTRLVNKMHALSGLPVDNLRRGTTFIELGFDSLFMTQVCRAIEVEFGVPITLRQLSEDLSSIPRLAEYLALTLGETIGASLTRPVEAARLAAARGRGPLVRAARFEEKELEGILQVLRQAFPSFYGGCSLTDFLREQQHKWLANPARTQDHVYGWVLETPDDGIVGFVALLPVRIKIGDREVAGGAGCSLAVLPAFRNYSLLLSKQLMDWGDRHFYITTTANEISDGLNRALGLHPVPIKDFSHQLLWLLRPEATVQLAISRSAWHPLQGLTGHWPGSALLKILARLWFINHRQIAFTSPALPIEPVTSFNEEFDELWQTNRKDFDIATVRRRTFLAWRHFGTGSRVGQTFVFACRDGGVLRGYIAVQERSPEAGYLSGHYVVTDLFYERARTDVLHNLMNHAFAFVSARGGSVFQVSGYSADVVEELKTQRPRIRRDRPDPYWYQGRPEFEQILGDARRWWPSGADGDSNL